MPSSSLFTHNRQTKSGSLFTIVTKERRCESFGKKETERREKKYEEKSVFQMIEDKVNMVIGEVFKVFGPVVFQSLLGGNRANGGAAKTSDAGSTVSVKSPFDDDDDGDFKSFVDDDDFFSKPKDNNTGSKISFVLPTEKSTEEPKMTSEKPEETTIVNEDNVTANAIE